MSFPPRILVVVESIDVDDSSGSKANLALIQNLKLAGYDLKVYHYTLKDIQLPQIKCVAVKENRRSILFFLSRIERYMRDYLKLKLHKPLQDKLGFSFTLFNDRNSIIRTLKKDQDYDPDLVLTLSKGGSFRPHHALLRMPEWHSKWMAYMHDPYPMHHYPKPYTWKEPGYKQKENFIRLISQKAAISAFPSKLLKEWMGQFYPEFLRTGVIIPHQNFDYDKEIFLPEFFDPAKFNLLHAGNLLGARNPKWLLKAYRKFLDRYPDAKQDSRLIFLGGSNERVLDEKEETPNIIASEEYLPFTVVYSLQQKAAVNIILEARAEVSPFLPGKFPHCINADKPLLVLGPKKSEVRRLLGEGYPFWSEIDDTEKISGLIGDLYQKWKISPENFRLNRPDLEEYLGAGHLKKVMDQVLEMCK